MREFLLFTIYAPLASWGEIAVGEARGSWDRPSRSAVLGLIAAALGITRDEQEAHDSLDAGYGVAVRLDAPGTPLVDYHTAQTAGVSDVKRRGAVTRAEVLGAGEPFTMLSRRAYRQDAVATVAVWAREGARWELSALAAAMRTPVFGLYAGRKANALGLPLSPLVISAADLGGAFRQRTAQTTCGPVKALKPRAGWGMEVMFDPCEGFSSGMEEVRTVTRRDAGAQRSRWQFGERTVVVGLLGSVESSENGGSGVVT
jgi:CRISPR system Cascade subunit CasD